MHPHRRRKKRHNYGIRTVEVERGPNGFGFTISGQQPCILSCIVTNSPADQAGLRAGDFLISVNGLSVSKSTHDAVVKLIGSSIGPIKMSIAEYYYSDSSDEEVDVTRMVNVRKPKYTHKPRIHRKNETQTEHLRDVSPKKNVKLDFSKKLLENRPVFNDNHPSVFNDNHPSVFNDNHPVYDENTNPSTSNVEETTNPIEYKALVGYLGTIEMPKQLLPNSRLQTVCSCIRKLRQEKRTPTAVLMTVLPACLTLKNINNQILAVYPSNRVVYISSTTDKDSRYFGLVTNTVTENVDGFNRFIWNENKEKSTEVEISNSCHVFVTDPKLLDHKIHVKKAEGFNITCTPDIITGSCLEFPKNALYIVSLVQNMYRLQNSSPNEQKNNYNLLNEELLVANSPQPSASSNSDSGIGFRDDCGNISDRILVVEFPAHRPPPVIHQPTHRPSAIDGSVDNFELSPDSVNYSINNVRAKQNSPKKPEYNKKSDLLNIRACDSTDFVKPKDVDTKKYNRLTVRAMPDPIGMNVSRNVSEFDASDNENLRIADVDTGQIFQERPVDVPENQYFTEDTITDFKSSVDNISVHSFRSCDLSTIKIFKTPNGKPFRAKKEKTKQTSCENLTDDHLMNKLSPKVYGVAKPNLSCEELSNINDCSEKCGFGSLQELCTWNVQDSGRRTVAVSEPDVRIERNGMSSLDIMNCEDNTPMHNNNTDGAASWAGSFEKLLDDPIALQTFAEFLKKEFSAENIYFWTACERYRKLSKQTERSIEAQKIYRKHLCVGAPEAVNVDSHGRQVNSQQLQDAEPSLFEQAQKQIFNLMKFDSYPRFLKSDLYKQCLAGTIDYPNLEPGLMIQSSNSIHSKLKKSLSNAEDRRRKSLLPWHRKNRSKSKDRGETEYNQRKEGSESVTPVKVVSQHGHSSQSSLTSLDLAMSCSVQDGTSSKGSHDELSLNTATTKGALCRVILNDGATTVVQIRPTETVRQLANRLLDKRGLNYSAYEVFIADHTKPLDPNELSIRLAGCEVTIEQRVVFKLDLPNRKVISVKSKASKILVDVLRPILHKYGFSLDIVQVSIGPEEYVDVNLPVTSVDGCRLNIQLVDDTNKSVLATSTQKPKPSLDEITNKVFEQLLHEKSETGCAQPPHVYDKSSVKSEDWGSEHSSGIFGRFLKRDSSMHERKKKLNALRIKGNSTNSSVEDITGEQATKKPLIAKLKAGVKLQVACSESDELYEGLKRAQRSRLEDQRGTEINFELPDFLKDKENQQTNNKFRKIQQNGIVDNSRFYNDEITIVPKQSPDKIITPPIATTRNLKLEEKQEETSHRNFDEFKEEETGRVSDPPPLPPKPKILPIKPSNWGQNGLFKMPRDVQQKNDRTKHTLYLEQPTSSFV